MTGPGVAPENNFSQVELDKFGALAHRWWDPQGPQKALHALNPPRLRYVAERASLAGTQVLDVGCGGGLLSEALASERPASFDVVTCMEMLEHVPDPGAIIEACSTLLKPGGRLFVSTLNRTPAAFALAIVGAEYVARLLPKGTHQYRDFIRPSELGGWLRAAGLQLEDVSGLMYEPWRNAARITSRTDVNYLASARKPA